MSEREELPGRYKRVPFDSFRWVLGKNAERAIRSRPPTRAPEGIFSWNPGRNAPLAEMRKE